MRAKLSILCLSLAGALPVLAQGTATPGVDARQANQQRGIDQGAASGALTGREAAQLKQGQDQIQRMEDKAKADGVVTAKERARVQHRQDVQSRRIFNQKHDRQHDLNHDTIQDRPARSKRAQVPS